MNSIPRRQFLKLLGLGAGATVLTGCIPSQTRGFGPNPNVVLIISDDQGYTDYGFMGHNIVQTPRLDKLASESVVFTRGYVTTALCAPSLSTMLTGLYPHQHKMTGNDPVNKGERQPHFEAFERCARLPEMLGRAGYLSFQSGKYWMEHYQRAGFTEGMTTHGRHGDDGLVIGRKTMQPIFDFIHRSHAAGKRFFVWYAPFMPHLPHNPPKRLLEKYASAREAAAYYAMCEWFDETCGQLLDYLDERGLSENTMVMYICDNGWPFWAKGSPYEMGVRTPIMIRWPGRVRPRMDTDSLAGNIDIAPTILRACGLEPTPEMPGINLLNSAQVSKRRVIFGENFCHDMANVERPAESLRARACIQGYWKLILWQNPQPDVPSWNKTRKTRQDAELYNLKADPIEKSNLAEKHPARVKAMTKLLDGWWRPA